MRKFMTRAICVSVIAIIGMMGITGCGKTLDGTQTVATIDGEKVPVGVASFALRYSQAQSASYFQQLAALYGEGLSAPSWDSINEGETKTTGELTKDDVMKRVEEMYVVRAHAKEYNVEISATEKEAIAAAAKTFIDKNTTSILRRMGVTQSDVETYLELETYYKKMYEPMLEDKGISVTDEEAKQSTVSYIFASINEEDNEEARMKLQNLLDELKKEEDIATFDMQAFTEENDETLMATTASFGDNEEEGTGLDDAVKEAAKTLKDGELYQEVIEGANGGGYFIVRMDKVSDEEATESKRESLLNEKKQTAFTDEVTKWTEAADIKVEDTVWGEVKLVDKEAYVVKPEPTPEATAEPVAPELETESGPVEGEGSEAEVEPAQ